MITKKLPPSQQRSLKPNLLSPSYRIVTTKDLTSLQMKNNTTTVDSVMITPYSRNNARRLRRLNSGASMVPT